jgi:hypothetical protein
LTLNIGWFYGITTVVLYDSAVKIRWNIVLTNGGFTMKYPESEKETYDKIKILFSDWKKTLSKSNIKIRGRYKPGDKCFSEDGFFPYYLVKGIKFSFLQGKIGIYGIL